MNRKQVTWVVMTTVLWSGIQVACQQFKILRGVWWHIPVIPLLRNGKTVMNLRAVVGYAGVPNQSELENGALRSLKTKPTTMHSIKYQYCTRKYRERGGRGRMVEFD